MLIGNELQIHIKFADSIYRLHLVRLMPIKKVASQIHLRFETALSSHKR
jgi:hypothetical protein